MKKIELAVGEATPTTTSFVSVEDAKKAKGKKGKSAVHGKAGPGSFPKGTETLDKSEGKQMKPGSGPKATPVSKGYPKE